MIDQVAFGQASKEDSSAASTILFVCEHGAARSTIAAAYFNKLAKESGLNYQAIFRGTDPDTSLTAGAKQGLARDGFDIGSWRPQPITSEDVRNATAIVAFDCILPINKSLERPIQQWNGIPPVSKDYETAKNQILEKVVELIKSLQK